MENNTDFENDVARTEDYTEVYFRATVCGAEFQILKLESPTHAQYAVLDTRGRDCVHMTLQTRRDTPRLYLSQIQYRPTCTIGEPMQHGMTTQCMVKALLLTVMNDLPPSYDRVYLKDMSTIECVLPSSNDSFPIPLAPFRFVITGKTWYEAHFGAKILNETVRQKLDAANARLDSHVSDTDLAVLRDALDSGLSHYTDEWYRVLGKVSTDYLSTIRSPTTWRTIFADLFSHTGTIAKRMGANIGCILFTSLQDYIEQAFGLPPMTAINMYIPRDTILAYPEASGLRTGIDTTPAHIDTKRKESLMKTSMLLTWDPIHYVGGKQTLKKSRIHRIRRHTTLISQLHRRETTRRETRKRGRVAYALRRRRPAIASEKN
jgi:hypothetical protein